MKTNLFSIAFLSMMLLLFCCGGSEDPAPPVEPPVTEDGDFYFGADLSYLNHILDKGGIYKSGGAQKDPYRIFDDKGTSLVRLRLWHTPTWTKTAYGDQGTQMYNDLADVEKSISKARNLGMKVLLDFHYSDTWADPGKQHIPAAWLEIKSITVLKDSVYNYTYKTLNYLQSKGLLPEYVQIGNETNCGMLYTDAPDGFPSANVCEGKWGNLNQVVNAAIKAVRDVSANSTVKTKIALHIADPKNVDWYFSGINTNTVIKDYDIIGFSYYPLWHTTVSINNISDKITEFKTKFDKDVIILETAYPWTTSSNDSYNNLLGGTALPNYPFTEQGQYDLMVKLTQEVKQGKGIGVIYWEPGWITSSMKDLWGTGSAWENAAFFNFDGNPVKAFDYTQFDY